MKGWLALQKTVAIQKIATILMQEIFHIHTQQRTGMNETDFVVYLLKRGRVELRDLSASGYEG